MTLQEYARTLAGGLAAVALIGGAALGVVVASAATYVDRAVIVTAAVEVGVGLALAAWVAYRLRR